MLCPAPQAAKIGVHKVQLTIVYFLMYKGKTSYFTTRVLLSRTFWPL